MKPCNSIAIALAGWLLLYPPWSTEKESLDPGSPLNRWYQVAEFGSLADCEANKRKVLQDMEKKARDVNPNYNDSESAQDLVRMRQLARCISVDDPSLKGN